MKTIRRFFDHQRPHFTQGGRFEKYYPAYEAIESIFFGSAEVTIDSPHVRDNLDVKRFMTLVIVALLPHLFFGIFNTGYQSHLATGQSTSFWPVIFTGLKVVLPIVLVTYVVGFFWEILFSVIRKHEISEGLFVSSMLFPLTLPPTIPLWQVALGISFGIVIGKEVFGGTGRNFLNPALTGRAFLFFAYPLQMSGDAVWTYTANKTSAIVDGFSGATPLSIASTAQNGGIEVALLDSGYSLFELSLGLYPGGIGATCTFLSILGALFLVILGIASWRIILGGVAGVLVTGYLINITAGPDSPAMLFLNPIYHLAMGGFAFGVAYMATDPVSAPDMKISKWVYGFGIGFFTLAIRAYNPAFPEGVMLAILFMNLFAPLMDHIEVGFRLKKRVPNV